MFKSNKFSKNFVKKTGDQSCHRCGATDHWVKHCPLNPDKEKGKIKTVNKGTRNFNKSDVRKAMIAAWGESYSEDAEAAPENETAHLCLMAKNDDETQEKEVYPNPQKLITIPKQDLVDLVMEYDEDWRYVTKSLSQSEKALKAYKDHCFWIENHRTDVQNRFFELFDKNLLLKELVEKLKQENIKLGIEIAQYKMMNIDISGTSSSSNNFIKEFEELKRNLEELKLEKAKIEKELETRKNRDISQYSVPKWIEEAQVKRTEGLGYVHAKHKGKKKKYVDLPSNKVCTFCGKTGHYVDNCIRKQAAYKKNIKQIWIKKSEKCFYFLFKGARGNPGS